MNCGSICRGSGKSLSSSLNGTRGLDRLEDSNSMNASYWATIMEVKAVVNKQLETARAEGVIGSSLAADVTLYCDAALADQLGRLGDELRFALITSTVSIQPLSASAGASTTEIDGLEVSISASGYPKCERCWHHREDIGSNAIHPPLCGRCVENVDGQGERRLYA